MLHVYHGNNVGHPLFPWTKPNQTLTYVMFIRSTSLEPKSQLTINLDPGWECPSLFLEENKKRKKKREKRRKFPIKNRKKAKERKFPIKDRKKTEEICRNVFGPDNIWTIQNCHQVSKKNPSQTLIEKNPIWRRPRKIIGRGIPKSITEWSQPNIS